MSAQIEHAPSQITDAVNTDRKMPTSASQSSRMLYIDNLRILLISMVIVVHLGVTYGAVGLWYYHDPVTNLPTAIILTFITGPGMAAGMGFFFLLAGYFTPGSYDRKGPGSFLRDRLVRLGIPLLIYDLLLDPLVVYIASGLQGSYWSFYSNYLLHERGIASGPVWFIAVIFGFIFALGLVTFVVRIWWPAGWIFQLLNVPVGYLPQYISLYILALIAYRHNWFFKLTPKMGKDWLWIALIASLIFVCLVFPSMMQASGVAGTRQASFPIAGGFQWLAFIYALLGIVHGCRGMYRHTCPLPSALESSREA